jgi:subtilisin family serine protease
VSESRRYTLDEPPFAGRTGRGVRIAVVDSGIAEGHPHVGAIAGTIVVGGPEPPDAMDRIGHGTAVAAAIREKAPDAELIAVKVFHDRLATNAASLANAVERAAEAGARLINLSLGTANPAHEGLLSAAVARAAERGAIVVSAREANGVRWLPGALTGVVGVLADWEGPREGMRMIADPGSSAGTVAESPAPERASTEGIGLTIVASAFPRPIPGVPPERNLAGVSFAVANATGFLARLLEGDQELRDVAQLGRMWG